MSSLARCCTAVLLATLLVPVAASAQPVPGGQLGVSSAPRPQTPASQQPTVPQRQGLAATPPPVLPQANSLPPRAHFAVDAHGVSLQMPVLRNHCRLETSQPADKAFLDQFLSQFGPSTRLLMLTMDCASLQQMRSSGAQPTQLNMVAYMTPSQVPGAHLATADRRATAQQICTGTNAQANASRLTATTPRDRAFELQGLSSTGNPVTAALFSTGRACYIGDIRPIGDATRQVSLRQVQGWTLIRGRLVAIAAFSTGQFDLNRSLVDSGNLVADMYRTNGEG